MTKGMKRLVAAFLAATLVACAAVGLVGCGPSDEEVVRQGVTEELDRLKNHDPALLEELAASSQASELAAFGIDAQAFVASYLDGFDYRIDEVAVDGDAATATVVFTCKSFSDYLDSLTAAADALAADESAANLSEEELNQAIGQAVMDSLASVPVTESAPTALPFALQDNVWTPTAEAEQMLANVLFAS